MILESETNTKVDKTKLRKRSLSLKSYAIQFEIDVTWVVIKNIFLCIFHIFRTKTFLKRISSYEKFFTSTFA